MVTPREKLEKMKAGQVVVTNDQEMDKMMALGDDAIYSVRSLPNPSRVGTKDQYIAWIGDAKTIGELMTEKIRQEAEEISELQEQIKRESMVYQGDLKREAMRRFGLTWEQVNLPYEEWAKIRARLSE